MINFSEKCLQFFKRYGIINLLCNREAYRSGHNGTDSKSVVLSGTEGSNPSASASGERPAARVTPAVKCEGVFLFQAPSMGVRVEIFITHLNLWGAFF